MPKKTKIDKMQLYKKYYEYLKDYRDEIRISARTKTVTNFSMQELEYFKDIYQEYYPKAQIDFNCGKCIFKMIDRLYRLIKKYEENNDIDA